MSCFEPLVTILWSLLVLQAFNRKELPSEPEPGRAALCHPSVFPVLTSTQVSKDVVALLRERDLVDGMSDESGLQQIAGILASFAAVGETFHVTVEPVHHIRTWTDEMQ